MREKILKGIIALGGFLFLFNFASADQVRLLDDPHEAWQARIDLIQEAKETIDIEYYQIQGGVSGRVLYGLLYESAERGVKVRLILNGKSQILIDRGEIAYLTSHSNIEIFYYHPWRQAYWPEAWFKHLHDKILLVDSQQLIAGGRNIGDKYFNRKDLVEKMSRDRDVYIKGNSEEENVPQQVQEYFNSLWESNRVKKSSTEVDLEKNCFVKFYNFPLCWMSKKTLINKSISAGENLKKVLEEERQGPYEFDRSYNWSENSIRPESIRFVHDPVDGKNQHNGTSQALKELFLNAKEKAVFQSPYVVPTLDWLSVFADVKDNGVHMTLLTNSLYSTPNILAASGTERYKEDIQQAGINVWEFHGEKDSLHHKTYIFDDETSVISSFNLDSLSSRFNTEMHYIVESEEFTNDVQAAINLQMQDALFVNEEGMTVPESGEADVKNPSFFKWFISYVIQSFIPLIGWYL
jgi:cardiolipin synthase C